MVYLINFRTSLNVGRAVTIPQLTGASIYPENTQTLAIVFGKINLPETLYCVTVIARGVSDHSLLPCMLSYHACSSPNLFEALATETLLQTMSADDAGGAIGEAVDTNFDCSRGVFLGLPFSGLCITLLSNKLTLSGVRCTIHWSSKV